MFSNEVIFGDVRRRGGGQGWKLEHNGVTGINAWLPARPPYQSVGMASEEERFLKNSLIFAI